MKYIPAPVIRAAQAYDNEAVGFVLRHFEGYITSRCLSSYTDEDGNEHTWWTTICTIRRSGRCCPPLAHSNSENRRRISEDNFRSAKAHLSVRCVFAG